jgi:methyltransferase (TIGR00027 family)
VKDLMKRERSSITAAGIALARAIESARPEGQRVCYDPYARRSISSAFYHFGKFFVDIGYSELRGPGVIGFLAARTRCIDDYLKDCLLEGLEQLVILGAGFDSRAYRFPALKGGVRIFEVDHPASQQVKKEKLAQVLGSIPEYVTYVPIDFEAEALDKLFSCGYRLDLKTLFIWEGVTMYLQPAAIDSTLAFIAANSPPGSAVIFDYIYTSLLDGTVKHGEVSGMRRYRFFTGEGLVFGIPEGQVRAFLEVHGFNQVEDRTSQALHAAYFSGPNQSRQVAGGYAIVSARVK